MENEPFINGYLRHMLDIGGSDLHLSVDYPPKARIHGNLQVLENDVLDAERLSNIMEEICFPKHRWEKYLAEHDLDFAHEIPGVARFRCNYLYNYHGMGGLEVVYEILINTMAVANTINEGKTFQLKSTMVTSNKQGMCTMDQCILRKYEANRLTYEAAMAQMTDVSVKAQLNAVWAEREKARLAAEKKKKK